MILVIQSDHDDVDSLSEVLNARKEFPLFMTSSTSYDILLMAVLEPNEWAIIERGCWECWETNFREELSNFKEQN